MIFGYFSNERIESEIMWCALRMAYKDNSCESHESIFYESSIYTNTGSFSYKIENLGCDRFSL